MKTQVQVARNTLSRFFNSAARGVVGLILVPILFVKIGKEGYGLMALIGTIAGLTALADLGLRPALSRHLAAKIALNDWAGASRLYSTGVLMVGLLFAPLALAFSLATPWLMAYAKISAGLHDSAEWVFRWWLPCEILVLFIIPVYSTPLVASNRFDIRNRLDVIGSLLGSVIFIALLEFTTWQMGAWVISRFFTILITVLLYRRAQRQICPQLTLRLGQFSTGDFSLLWGMGRYLMGASLVQTIKYTLDPLVLTWFLGVRAVAIYQPGNSLANFTKNFNQAFVGQMDVLMTQLHTQGEQAKLNRLFKEGSRMNFLLGMPVVLVLTVFAQPIMRLWVGRSDQLGEEYWVAAQVLICMSLVAFTYFAEGLFWPVLVGMNHLDFIIKAELGFALANLGFEIVLLKFTHLGVVSVALASLVERMVSMPVFLIHTIRLCKLPVGEFIGEVYAGPMVALLVLSGFGALLNGMVGPLNIFTLVGCVAAVLVLWAIYSWQWGLNADQRHRVLGVCNRLSPVKIFPHAA